MMRSKLSIITFLIFSVLAGFWSMEMTASKLNELKFYLIYIPLLIFLVSEFYLINKIRNSIKTNLLNKLSAFFIIPLILLIFLFISFGEDRNKICISGDCENGYGVALYIKSERTTRSANEFNDGELQYYSPEFLGRNWFNNIVWYDGNPISCVYRGEFKNGYFHGIGQEFWFTYEYEENHQFDDKYKFIDGIYFVEGEWERGWLFWDKESRRDGHIKLKPHIERLLKDYKLDKKGFYRQE